MEILVLNPVFCRGPADVIRVTVMSHGAPNLTHL